ncbi:hypothetical protein AURDEDRAFT_165551 [Auricularia subglabra TFB-10046 SS5]|nr:hypothetical protein AURDEDRAFT_165551 [Auricularia subglabra TFB-10046 SS5]
MSATTAAANIIEPPTIECPDCSEQIRRGKNTLNGALSIHRGSKACVTTQKKKQKATALATAKAKGAAFFQKFKSVPKKTQAENSNASRVTGHIGDDDEVVLVGTNPGQPVNAAPAPAQPGVAPSPWSAVTDPALRALLMDLRAGVSRLPEAVAVGSSGDTLEMLAVDPRILEHEEGPWPAINQVLDRVLQTLGARLRVT